MGLSRFLIQKYYPTFEEEVKLIMQNIIPYKKLENRIDPRVEIF